MDRLTVDAFEFGSQFTRDRSNTYVLGETAEAAAVVCETQTDSGREDGLVLRLGISVSDRQTSSSLAIGALSP